MTSVPLELPTTAELTAKLAGALKATVFASNLRINPRRLQSIASDAATSFQAFASGELKPADANTYGRALAADGLGHGTMLALVETLLRATWGCDSDRAGAPAAIAYSSALMAGYMAAREETLLQEQERTRLALDRVRSQQAD